MSERQPPMQRPPQPKHVPFWPVLIGMAFMVAVVVAGIVASNHARSEHLTVATSTLPPRNATTTTFGATTTTAAGTQQAASAGSDACTSANLAAAIRASGKVDPALVGNVTVPQYKCVEGYALARVVPSNPKVDSVTADFKLQADKTWKMLALGEVNPLDDGVPSRVAAQLTLS